MSHQTELPHAPGNPLSEVNQLLTTLFLVALFLFGVTSANGGPVLGFDPQTAAATTRAAQGAKDIGALEPGKPVTRELGGGEADSYQIALASGQYLRLVVDQSTIGLTVSLIGPDGMKLVETDQPATSRRTEPVELVAESAGGYRVEVRSSQRAATGNYRIQIGELRMATPQDRSRDKAQSALREGRQLESRGNAQSLRSALAKHEEAFTLAQSAGDQALQGQALNRIGLVYNALDQNQKAMEYYNRALPLHRAAQDRLGEAITLNNIGGLYLKLSQPREAMAQSNEAYSIYQGIGDREGEAAALSNLGVAYRLLNQWEKALDHYNRGLELHKAMGDRKGQSISLNNIGGVLARQGKSQDALRSYNQSLLLSQEVGDRRTEAMTLNGIAVLYNSLGKSQEALEYHNKVLPIRRETGDRSGEAVTLNNIGRVHEDLGQKHRALAFFNQSLPLREAVGDRAGQAVTLNNMARLCKDLGEYQKALDYYHRSLELRRAVTDKSGEANTLNGLGALYASLGENQRALDHYEQALSHSRTLNDPQGQAVVLGNMGIVYRKLGEYQKALDCYNESLPHRKAVGDPRGESATLGNIGMVYNALGDKHRALEYYDKALRIAKDVGDRSREGAVLNSIGSVYISLRDYEKALDYENQALALQREVADRQGQATTLSNLAFIEGEMANLIQARAHIEEALTILESLRTSVVSHELRASYFASAQGTYELCVDLLMRLDKQRPGEGHVVAALQASEQTRARSLLELLAEMGAGLREGVDTSLLERERSLQHQINVKAESQMRLLGAKPSQAQTEAIRKEIDALTTEYQTVQANIRRTSPRYASLTQPQPISLKEIQQQVLDSNTLLLEYALGKDRSYLWAVSPTSIMSYELPKRVDVEAAARRVYSLLTARQPVRGETEQQRRERVTKADADFAAAADRLSQMLLGPVASQLSKKTLVIVADGALQYVPFGALPTPVISGQSPVASRTARPLLIVDHEIVSLPSASVMSVLRRETAGRKTAAKGVAVLADPVFDKDDDRVRLQAKVQASPETTGKASDAGGQLPRDRLQQAVREVGVTGERGSIPRLPFSRQEADAILAAAPAGAVMKALGFNASRATATSAELQQYRIVHFATHGLLNTEHPELSGLVLSLIDEQGQPQDGFLRLHELYNLSLAADLVVLSACQTGLGKEIRGEGLVGLTRGFMYAGTPRVVASLWKVDDLATADLMKDFYQGMLKDGMRPAAALKAAQVAMLKNKRWQSPYYWAPFVLHGEWR